MDHEVSCEWKEGMHFQADISGYKLDFDASPDHGGENKGTSPKRTLLAALAGCTGLDVISILQKMRQPVEGFSMEVGGDLTDEDPKYYDQIKVTYKFKGDLDREKVEKAVNLSVEKYCGVNAMLSELAKISREIVITA